MKQKRRTKKILATQHRRERYLYAIQKVIDGKADPGYAAERWRKLQQVEGKTNDK